MKKLLGIGVLFVGVLLLTGCGGGNKLTCSATYSEGGESMTQTLVAHLDKDNKVESYDLEYELSSQESADTLYSMYSSFEGVEVSKSGKTVTIKNAQKMEGSDMEIVGMTKDEVKELITASDSSVTCK